MKANRRRWWTRLITIAAVLIVFAATLSVVFRFAVDSVPEYRTDLESFVARSVGHPARIGAMALRWQGLRPTLELRDVALLDKASGAALLEARRLSLGISLWRLLNGGRTPNRIEASGIQLDADVDTSGHATLRGFDAVTSSDGTQDSLLADLSRFDSIRVLDSELLLHDARLAASGQTAPLSFRVRFASIVHARTRYTVNAALDPPASLARRGNLRAVLDGDPAQPGSWQGNWQLDVQQIAGWPWLAALLEPGIELTIDRSGLSLGGDIVAGRPAQIHVDAQLGSLVARRGTQVRARLSGLSLRAKGEPQEDGSWRLTVDQFAVTGTRGSWNAGPSKLSRSTDASGGMLTLETGLLRLDDLAPWAALLRTLPPAAARLRDLRGDAEAITLMRTPPEAGAAEGAPAALNFRAQLRNVGLVMSGEQPGFSGLSGQLEGSLDKGHLMLDSQPLQLSLPAVFDHVVAIESLRGELAWERVGEDLKLSSPALELGMPGTKVNGDAALRLSGTDPAELPLLSLHLALSSDDAAALKPLMPRTWGPNTREWLTRALTRAEITHGELKIDAPMTPRAADGHITMPWRLDLDVIKGELAYAPAWPAITGLSGQLHFHDGGLQIVADGGNLGGGHVTSLKATIGDFQTADLVLDGHIDGDGSDFYRVLRHSPMQIRLTNLLRATEASGPTSADIHLRIPLHLPEPVVQASGEVRFDDAQLKIQGQDEPLRHLNGLLAFSGAGVTADALTARLYNTAINARIQPEPGAPDGVLLGEFAFAPAASGGLEQAFVPEWLRASLSGQATMQLRLPFSGPDAGLVSLRSDLIGVTSTLPPPLEKSPAEPLALKIGMGGDPTVPLRVQIDVGDLLRTTMRFAEADGALHTRAVEVRLGAGTAPRAETDGFVISGAPATLDLRRWGALLGVAQAGGGELPFARADLQPERLVYRSYALGKTHLIATPAANKALHLSLEGAANGQIDWLPDAGGHIIARLQKLALESLPPLPAEPAETVKESPFDPGTAPTLDIDCTDLSLGTVDFGHLAIATARVADGQHIERLQLSGGKLVVDAHGSWLRRGDAAEPGSSAEFSFDVRSSAIGDVLKVFGYTPNLRAADSHFTGQLAWPRVPEGLELSQAEGEVKLDVKRGTLKAVDPGAGRVLGLINLYALPRRLLLDFRDVVSDGLAFDTLAGSFKLAAGNAETKDLKILGPQAKVQLVGRIGLAARDYDQRVIVTPDISTGVTVGATLLGGPIGGGIALVAQQLFGKPFNRLARFSYRVSGSWANPEIVPEAVKEPEAVPVLPKPNPNGVPANG